MFFIMGITQDEEKLDFSQMTICPECGAYGRIEIFCIFSQFTFFFIPLFKFGRKYYAKMTCCGKCAPIEKPLGDAVRKGETVYIDPNSLSFEERANTCPYCGYPLSIDFDFCPKCGKRL